jgi:hypothetical protein
LQQARLRKLFFFLFQCSQPFPPSDALPSFQAAQHAIAVERTVREDNARAAPVLISGAAFCGFFVPSDKKSLDGRAVYFKCGDGNLCIEHFHGMWQVKSVSDIHKNESMGFVTGGRALEACMSRNWCVRNTEAGYKHGGSVKLVTQAHVERVKDLSLAGFNIGPKGAARLAEFLARLTLLSSLDLSSNKLTCQGAAQVAACLTHLTAISSLSMRNNKLGFDGAIAIMTAFTHPTRLTSLDLGTNELTADDGARICAAAVTAGMTSLKELHLHGSPQTDKFNFSASDIVGCFTWRQLKLPQPPDEIVRSCKDQTSDCNVAPLVSYLSSQDKVPCHAIRIFIVGESTVALPSRSLFRVSCSYYIVIGHFFELFYSCALAFET